MAVKCKNSINLDTLHSPVFLHFTLKKVYNNLQNVVCILLVACSDCIYVYAYPGHKSVQSISFSCGNSDSQFLLIHNMHTHVWKNNKSQTTQKYECYEVKAELWLWEALSRSNIPFTCQT